MSGRAYREVRPFLLSLLRRLWVRDGRTTAIDLEERSFECYVLIDLFS